VFEGHLLLTIEAGDGGQEAAERRRRDGPRAIRPDLAEAIARHAYGLDENRPEAVARRHGRGHRTARENIADLVDPDSFVEYGPLMIAAQRRRRSVQDLMEKTSGDGMVAGIGTGQRRAVRASAPGWWPCPTTTWCWPAPRAT
jgi:acetyl-CoA carboxylase carboxyltransferase component